jgi:type II secretory pathway component PulF
MAFALRKDQTPKGEFEAMADSAKNLKSPLEAVYREWIYQLEHKTAGNVSQALRTTIPQSEYVLLASAEETSSLAQGLEFVARSVDRIEEMRRVIVDALRIAILPVIMLFGIIYGVDAFFFPSIEESLPRKSWPFVTKFVADVAHDVGSIVVVLSVLIPALLALWSYLLPRLTGKMRRLAELTVFFNKYRDYSCCLFLVNMQFLMDANLPPREALERILKSSSPYMRWHLNLMLDAIVTRGMEVGKALTSTGLFNASLTELMADYARWSDWHTQIGDIAASALELVARDVKRMGPRIENAVKLTLGSVVLIVLAAGGLAMSKLLAVGL